MQLARNFLLLYFLLCIQVNAQTASEFFNTSNDSISTSGTYYQVDDHTSYVYQRPKPLIFFQHAGQNFYQVPKAYFKKKYILPALVITASTLALIQYDDPLIDAAQQFGRYIGLNGDNNTKDISPIKGIPLYVPTDLSAGLYYIGDGITELAINTGFYLYGSIRNDARALTTASQLSEGLAAVGITIQILKHLSGRESPFVSSASGGRWIWFPNPVKYSQAVPHYDAFPSGHLAIAMMTTTVIAKNYPEKKWIRPLGYGLMALCGYQMMNNGVHWASDYPLALAIGYCFAQVSVARGHQKVHHPIGSPPKSLGASGLKMKLSPAYVGYGAGGLRINLQW